MSLISLLFSVCSEIWFSVACVSVGVAYVRVCSRYSHTLSMNASLLITVLRLNACNLKKQILPLLVSLYTAHECSFVYQLCVCVQVCLSNVIVFIVSHSYMFEWVDMSDIYILYFTYSTSLSSFPDLCVCVCYFLLCVLRVWVFPLLETQFKSNSLLSWASGCLFKLTALHSYSDLIN